MTQLKLRDGLVIGALHVPALPGTPGSRTPVDELVDFAVENSRLFESAGADALYVQNVGGGIGPKRSNVDTVALMSVITRAVVQAVSIPVGVTLAGHDAAGAIAVAFAGGASFVRLKVYVGAMLKAEGVIEGCAEEALRERDRLGAESLLFMVDIHDRTGISLGRETVVEVADWAARFGRADALIVTGATPDESVQMLDAVRDSGVKVPLFCGGSANVGNVSRLLEHCQGVIVSSAWMSDAPTPKPTWDPKKIRVFMERAKGHTA